jgi:hypothetical protein
MANKKTVSESRYGTDNLRRFQRIACNAVITAYQEIKSVLGTIPGRDYEQASEGKGAQYDPNRKMGMPFIDFVVDVETTIRQALEDDLDYKHFIDTHLPCIEELTTLTERDLRLQEAVGRFFIGRELFPVKRYFVRIKS